MNFGLWDIIICIFSKKDRRSRRPTEKKTKGRTKAREGQKRRLKGKFWDSRESQEGFKGKYEVPGVGP